MQVTYVTDGSIPVAEDFNGNTRRFAQALGVNTTIANYVAGDMLYASATDTLDRRPIGNPGDVWTVVGGLPAWSSAGSVSGTWAQRNLQGTLTASALSVTADAVMLRNSGLGVKVHEGVSSLTVDPATAGLNGRDQTAAFTASQDLYAYWISNGTTVRGVWADSAPPTGPDLTTLSAFAGYTYWCPIMVAKWTALSTFLPARVRGGWVHYDAAQSVLANGTQTAETTVGCSGAVPASASRFTLYYRHGPGASNFMLRVVSGSDYLPEIPLLDRDGGTVTVPNVSQQVFYAQSSGARVDLWVQGYECPNGA